MPRNRRLVAQAVLTPILATLRARDEHIAQLRPVDTRVRLEVANKADTGPAVLRIYDSIGGWFGITASEVAEALDEISSTRDLQVRINSPGGDVFDGTAIYNLLATWQGNVDVIVDGLAASAASFIAQAGDTITMNRGTQMMIHDAHGFTLGNAGDHRATADLLDGVSDEIAGIYAARAGLTKAEWRDRMVEEHWYNAEAAVEAGLADRTADSDDEDQDEEAAQKAAASWRLRPAVAAQATEPPPEDAPSPALDELAGDTFASLGEWLDEVFDPSVSIDPQVFADTIKDVYANAPAPPAATPAPSAPQSTVSVQELADAIMEGACP